MVDAECIGTEFGALMTREEGNTSSVESEVIVYKA